MALSIFEAVVDIVVPSVVSVLAYRYLKWRWISLVILAAFWGTAVIVGPVLNHELISLADLLDTTQLHHEHVVTLLGVLGVIGALWAEVRLRRSRGRTNVGSQAGLG